ncbi:MAG: outer membrane beta-barrel protein [Proteobacteria bacterium]|nr:outer membrane beta-barrel protein [Pseudomonadota bacterium]
MSARVAEIGLLARLAIAIALGTTFFASTSDAAPPEPPNLHGWPTTTTPATPRGATQSPDADDTLVAPMRRASPDGPVPGPDSDVQAATADDDDPRRAEALTAPVADAEDEPPRDGAPERPEPAAPVDGTQPATDTRSEVDYQAFHPVEPPAGYDARAFSVEPEPLADRRVRNFARLDPYVPAGVRIGSFTLYSEAELAGVAYSNLFRSHTGERSDVALDTRGTLRLISNWNVHALELAATGLASFHNDFSSEDDRAWNVEARGQLDFTRRANLQAFASHDVAQESRGSVNFGTPSSSRADVVTDRTGLAFNQRFNHLTIQLRGAVTERDYSSKIDETSGALISSLDRDLTQREAAVRATWMFKPTFGAFAETGIDERTYAAANPADGMSRNSSGERYRVGISLGSTGARLRGEAAVGYLHQGFDDQRLADVSGVIVDANVAWRITGLTSLLVTARTDVGESTVTGSGGSLLRQGGVELKHAFRRNLIATAGVKLSKAEYAGTSVSERDLTSEARLDYVLSREVTLFGRFAHIDYSSSTPSSAYTADEFRLGVRLHH